MYQSFSAAAGVGAEAAPGGPGMAAAGTLPPPVVVAYSPRWAAFLDFSLVSSPGKREVDSLKMKCSRLVNQHMHASMNSNTTMVYCYKISQEHNGMETTEL